MGVDRCHTSSWSCRGAGKQCRRSARSDRVSHLTIELPGWPGHHRCKHAGWPARQRESVRCPTYKDYFAKVCSAQPVRPNTSTQEIFVRFLVCGVATAHCRFESNCSDRLVAHAVAMVLIADDTGSCAAGGYRTPTTDWLGSHRHRYQPVVLPF